ncbi:MAG TPA: hypothetical protein VIL20_19575 [Sandaracinaceae bacterium]
MQLAFDFGPERTRVRGATPGARTPAALEARISRALSIPVELVVTDNRRSMVATRRRGPRLEVRLHHMFLDAPEHVIEELLCYLAEGDPRSSRALGRYIEENRHRVKRRRILLRTRGRYHDLADIFAEVVRTYFPEGVSDARITWGKMPPRRAGRRSIRLGTYTHDQRLVRIHPALDQAFVPRFFVAFVVFHELLHHVVPARRTGTRIDYHPPEFRAREAAHPDYHRAVRWEADHLDALLAYRG